MELVSIIRNSIRQAGGEYMENHVRPEPASEKLRRIRYRIRDRRWEWKIDKDAMSYRARCNQAPRGSLNPLPMFLELFSQPFKLFRRNHA